MYNCSIKNLLFINRRTIFVTNLSLPEDRLGKPGGGGGGGEGECYCSLTILGVFLQKKVLLHTNCRGQSVALKIVTAAFPAVDPGFKTSAVPEWMGSNRSPVFDNCEHNRHKYSLWWPGHVSNVENKQTNKQKFIAQRRLNFCYVHRVTKFRVLRHGLLKCGFKKKRKNLRTHWLVSEFSR